MVRSANDDLALMNEACEEARLLSAALRPSQPPAPLTDVLPDLPPGYEAVRPLRSGSQANAYEARVTGSGRRVALKILRSGASEQHDAPRLEREARILARLDHPSIVRIMDAGRTPGGRPFAATEFVDGQPITDYARDRLLSVEECTKLFLRIVDGVAAAHIRGVIHRDLKPSNILVEAGGTPRILDFGLAKVLRDGGDLSATHTSGFLGTLAYASPEQIGGHAEDVDVRADIYALGVICYELLTGRLPHDTDLPLRAAADAIMAATPTRPGLLRPEISRDLETVLLKCLAKDRDHRYASAALLGDDLRRALAHEPIEARRYSPGYLLSSLMRRHRVTTAVATGFLLAGMGSGVGMGLLYASSQQRLQVAQQENKQLRDELAKLKEAYLNPGNWTAAFSSAEALKKLTPEEGWTVISSAWSEMKEDHPKQQLLKSMSVAKPPFLLRALNLGATDPSPKVQNWAFIYLRDLALIDFAKDSAAYAAWYEEFKDMPLEDVRRANLQRFVQGLKEAPASELPAKLELIGRSAPFQRSPDLLAAATEFGLIDRLIGLIADPNTPEKLRTSASRSLHGAALPEQTVRDRLLPLLDQKNPSDVRGAAARLLGSMQAKPAVPGLLRALVEAAKAPHPDTRMEVWTYSRALGEIGDPAAIPTMIAVIQSDDTYDTVYGVGYFGLGKITGVEYHESHNGAWWGAWWDQNKTRFPESVRSLEIPELPKRSVTPSGDAKADEHADAAPLTQTLFAQGDPKKLYFLMGPHPEAAVAPELGYRLLLVLPGGDGSAEFRPFVGNVFKQSVPRGYLLAQLVAPQWTADQGKTIVWPTAKSPFPGAEFTTEEFIAAVVKDISARYTINRRHVTALGWSSGGPPIYASLVTPESPLTGGFVAMSVFKPETMPPLGGVKGRSVYILHSPTDFIKMNFPEAARDQLSAAGARATLSTYEGGHGWHGDVFSNIRAGLEWLDTKPVQSMP